MEGGYLLTQFISKHDLVTDPVRYGLCKGKNRYRSQFCLYSVETLLETLCVVIKESWDELTTSRQYM